MSRVRRQHVKCASVTLVPAKLIARNFVEEHRQMPVVIRIVCAVLIAFLAAVTGAATQTSVKGAKPGRKNAPRERDGLFDIVS
jgi:hypothetical protein